MFFVNHEYNMNIQHDLFYIYQNQNFILFNYKTQITIIFCISTIGQQRELDWINSFQYSKWYN